MKRGRSSWIVGAIALMGLGLLVGPPAEAQRGPNQDVATVAATPGSVAWVPRIGYEEMTLTVSGRGYTMSEVFRHGASANFAPVDQAGVTLPDGTYKWEIRVAPDRLSLEPSAFRNGKISADGRYVEAPAAPRGALQSGVFRIKNGAIVDSSLVEPQSAPARVRALSLRPEIDDSDAAAPRN